MVKSIVILQAGAEVLSSRKIVDSARQQLVEERSQSNLAEVASHGPLGKARKYAGDFLHNGFFEFGIGLIIALNTTCIGFEQQYRIEGRDGTLFDIFEGIFLAVYIIELSLRFWVEGTTIVKDDWVKFDIFLILTSVISQFMQLVQADGANNSLGLLMVLKTARLAKIARALRLFKQFRQLWMLVSGLLHSARTMMDTLLLLGILLFMIATLGIELITLDERYIKGHYPEAYRMNVRDYFPSLPLTMLTLLQFVSMDSIGAIYRPMIIARPFVAVYFVLVILLAAVVFMNIVTAVIVNGAMEQAAQEEAFQMEDEARKRKEKIKDLMAMFDRLDANQSGRLERHEIMNASTADKGLLEDFMGVGSPLDVFDELDTDGGGSLDIDEFCQGLYDSTVSKNPIELRRMDKRVKTMRLQQDAMQKQQAAMNECLTNIQKGMETLIRTVAFGNKSNTSPHAGHQFSCAAQAAEYDWRGPSQSNDGCPASVEPNSSLRYDAAHNLITHIRKRHSEIQQIWCAIDRLHAEQHFACNAFSSSPVSDWPSDQIQPSYMTQSRTEDVVNRGSPLSDVARDQACSPCIISGDDSFPDGRVFEIATHPGHAHKIRIDESSAGRETILPQRPSRPAVPYGQNFACTCCQGLTSVNMSLICQPSMPMVMYSRV